MMWNRVIFIPNEGQTMNVMSFEEYQKIRNHKPNFDNETDNTGCVEVDGFLYPIRKQKEFETTDKKRIGVYPCDNGISFFVPPETEEEKKNYDAKKVIEFNNTGNYRDIIMKMDQLRNDENTKLLIKDNVFEPYIDQNDSPALKLMKESLTAKKIDPESYRQRLGPDFSNTMRLLTSKKNHTITLKKMVSLSKAYDLNIDITISDKPGAVNPMGKAVTTRVTDDELATEPILEPEEQPIFDDDNDIFFEEE